MVFRIFFVLAKRILKNVSVFTMACSVTVQFRQIDLRHAEGQAVFFVLFFLEMYISDRHCTECFNKIIFENICNTKNLDGNLF